MDRERINVVIILLDHTFNYAIYGTQDNGQLCPPVKFVVANIRNVCFFERPKMKICRLTSMPSASSPYSPIPFYAIFSA